MKIERPGLWCQTYSGIQFWHADPRPEEILIEDIAHALSNLCRFAGHTREFYSVAQHSVLVSQICVSEDALWGLLHDAAEAYCVDLPSPLKRLPGLERYHEIEAGVMTAVCERFGLRGSIPPGVKRADEILLLTEQRELLGPQIQPWDTVAEPLEGTIIPWQPSQAKQEFLNRFRELTGPQAASARRAPHSKKRLIPAP